MNKKEFLEALEKELKQIEASDSTEVIEYYEELIDDRIENGEKEKKVIESLDVSEITRGVKIQEKIDTAVKKPTISNGVAALIAFLGVLSLPMLITVGAVAFAGVITLAALLFSLFMTVGALLVASIVGVVALIAAAFTGELPVATVMFSVGIALILVGLFWLLARWVFKVSKEIIVWSMNALKKRFLSKKGEK
jgi:uncharacterized membrane protein